MAKARKQGKLLREVVRNEETQGEAGEKRSSQQDLGVTQHEERLASVWVGVNLEGPQAFVRGFRFSSEEEWKTRDGLLSNS